MAAVIGIIGYTHGVRLVRTPAANSSGIASAGFADRLEATAATSTNKGYEVFLSNGGPALDNLPGIRSPPRDGDRLVPSNLAAFGLPERLRCSLGVRKAAGGSPTVEAAAQKLCEFFFEELVGPAGERACALVRFYMTQPFSALPGDLQEFATAAASVSRIGGEKRCLTLLGTAGVEQEWNSRSSSRGHKAIPLV